MSNWRIEILNPSGELQGDLSGLAFTRRFTKRRNRPEIISLNMDLSIIEEYARDSGVSIDTLLKEGVNEIHIWKGSRKVVSGQINYSKATLTSERQIYEVRAVGWLALFSQRFTREALSFTAEDQGDILWDLIDHTQTQTNGDFGITQGTIEATVDRDRNYPIDKNIGDALVQMTEVIDGPDIEFTADKVFNVYQRLGENRPYIVFEYPRNIKLLDLEKDATGLVNYTILRGQGNGDVQLRQVVEDVASQTTYKLRELVLDLPDVSEDDTLTEHGNAELVLAVPKKLPSVTLDGNRRPFLGEYGLGDSIKILVNDHPYFTSISNRTYRIEEIDVSIDEDDKEEIQLGLSI